MITIMDSSGSTPRNSGARMLVLEDGCFLGTIGGGRIEGEAIERAKVILQTGGVEIKDYNLSSDAKSGMDMICGGRLTVLIERLSTTSGNRTFFNALWKTLQQRQPGRLMLGLAPGPAQQLEISRRLVADDGSILAETGWIDESVADWSKDVLESKQAGFFEIEGGFLYRESITLRPRLYLVGAGHVSQRTASLAGEIGFETVVMDDREEFANSLRFPKPICIKLLDTFKNCLNEESIGADCFIVIVTRGHLHDENVLRQALNTDADYIGMIGSRKKRDAIYRTLMSEGVLPSDLDRVYSPIGLPIGAETPGEIAVSIVSELIQVRSGVVS